MNGFEKGIAAACKQLRDTAEDYEQMANRLRTYKIRTPVEQKKVDELEQTAKVLRGQIGHILQLKE